MGVVLVVNCRGRLVLTQVTIHLHRVVGWDTPSHGCCLRSAVANKSKFHLLPLGPSTCIFNNTCQMRSIAAILAQGYLGPFAFSKRLDFKLGCMPALVPALAEAPSLYRYSLFISTSHVYFILLCVSFFVLGYLTRACWNEPVTCFVEAISPKKVRKRPTPPLEEGSYLIHLRKHGSKRY